MSFLIDEFFTDTITIDGIRALIVARIRTETYTYVPNSWIAIALYFFPSRIEILRQQFIKDTALRTKWIKKGENFGQSLRTWIIVCKGVNGYGPSFRKVKVQLELLLFEIAPDYIVYFSKITNWTELLAVVDENHFARMKPAHEDIIIFKENLKGATLVSTTTPTQFNGMTAQVDDNDENNEELNTLRYGKGNYDGHFRSSDSHGNVNGRFYNNHKSNNGNSYNACGKNGGNYYRGSNGQGGRGLYNCNLSTQHHEEEFKIYDGCNCYRCRQYKQMVVDFVVNSVVNSTG